MRLATPLPTHERESHDGCETCLTCLALGGGLAVSSAQDANQDEASSEEAAAEEILAASDEISSEEMVNCVSLTQIDRTRVVDDHTLLFYMRNDDIYRNVLPHRCPGLDNQQRFMYRVPITQLCSVDVITVLDDLGSGFMPGASCGLGKFQPISETMAEEIIAAAERADERG